MDSATNLILDYNLVHVSETGSSVAMEKEALKQSLDRLLNQGVDILLVHEWDNDPKALLLNVCIKRCLQRNSTVRSG